MRRSYSTRVQRRVRGYVVCMASRRGAGTHGRQCLGSDTASTLRNGRTRQRIGAIVQGVAAVARHLVPRHVVALHLGEERFPQVAVVDQFLLLVAPVVLAPRLVPLVAEAVDHVGAVAMNLCDAPTRE